MITYAIFELEDTFVFSHLCQKHLKLYRCVSIHNTSAYEVLSESHIFYIWQPFLFLYVCNNLSIPCLEDKFVFGNTYEVLSESH